MTTGISLRSESGGQWPKRKEEVIDYSTSPIQNPSGRGHVKASRKNLNASSSLTCQPLTVTELLPFVC